MTNSVFDTSDLGLASYLHATGRLKLETCELNGDGRVHFLFEDEQAQGNKIAAEYEGGAECSVVRFYDSLHHMRKAMSRHLRGSGHEKGIYNGNHIYNR